MTSCFSLSVAANPFCQQGFISNKPACDMLGPNTSLNKSPVHGMVHKAHRLQKRTTETEPLSSNGIRKAALSDGRRSSKERPGETAHCQGSPSSHIPFLVHQQSICDICIPEWLLCQVELLVTCLSLPCWKADPGCFIRVCLLHTQQF